MRPLLTILAALCIQVVSAQSPAQVIEQLNDNSDQQVLTRFAIDGNLGKLDSAQLLPLIAEIEKESVGSSPVIKTRIAAIKARLLFYKLGPGDSLYADQMKDAVYKAHELDEAFMIAEYSRWYSEMLNSLKYRNEAVQYALNAIVLQEQLGLQYFPDVQTFYLTIGELFFRTRNPRECIKWINKGITYSGRDSVIPVNYANGLNNMALSYRNINDHKNALAANEKCMAYSRAHGMEDWYLLSYYNRLPSFIDLGHYDSLDRILPILYKESMESHNEYAIAGAWYYMGQVARRRRQFPKAVQYLKQAEDYANKIGIRSYRLNICKELAICYDSLHQFDKSLSYYKEFRFLDDSLAKADASQRSDYLMAKANFEKQQIDLRKLRTTKDSDIRLRNIGIIVLAVLSGLVIWWLNRKRKRAKQSQQQAEHQLRRFMDDILNKERQIEDLKIELEQQSNNTEKASKVEELAQQMILTEEDWVRFQLLFNKTYPGFLLRLREKAPGITEAELRMATLVKIQLGTRQISAMQGISTDTVHKTRQRLRQRFGTTSTAELEAMIATV
jgi:tetratricopeptide (TPR) repeat protein/DNA-binding CsgD family transcriptional regulator